MTVACESFFYDVEGKSDHKFRVCNNKVKKIDLIIYGRHWVENGINKIFQNKKGTESLKKENSTKEKRLYLCGKCKYT